MRLVVILLLSLIAFVPSSSFFWQSYIEEQISRATIQPALLSWGINQGSISALSYQLTLETPYTTRWFYFAHQLGKKSPHVAWQLGSYYRQQGNFFQAEIWFKQGALGKHVASIQSLVHLYLAQNKYLLATQLLLEFEAINELLPLQMEVALKVGDELTIQQLLTRLTVLPEHATFYQQLLRYQVDKIAYQAIAATQQCENDIQFFSTDLEGLKQADNIIAAFQSHPLASFFCFNSPKYIPRALLTCNAQSNKSIYCDEQAFPDVIKQTPSRYIALILEKGGANVYQGVVYLDKQDTSAVFAHESSHLLGFVDEYALPKNHQFCQEDSPSTAINLVVLPKVYQGNKKVIRQTILNQLPWGEFINDDTPILTQLPSAKNTWLLGTPLMAKYQKRVGVFPSETCQNTSQFAFKALKTRTQLEYFELMFPKLYLNLLEKYEERFKMPSHQQLY